MKMSKRKLWAALTLLLLLCRTTASKAEPVGTAFTHQGWITDGNQPAEGLRDFQFKLFDAATDGRQIAGTIEVNDVNVVDGHFTLELDFCQPEDQQGRVLLDVFGGGARWLEIGVRPALGDRGPTVHGLAAEPYAILSARQKITVTPYALHAMSGGGLYDVLRWPSNWNLGVEGTPKPPGDAGGQNLFNMGKLGVGPETTYPTERLDLSWSGGVNARIGRYNYLGSCHSSATLVLGNNVRARTDSVHGIVVGNPHETYGYRVITMSMDGIQFYGRTGAVKVGDPLDVATERMRITNDGKVGIGTTTPRSIFEVGGGYASFSTFPVIGPNLQYGTHGIGLNLVRKSDGTWEAAGDGGHNAGAAMLGSIGGQGLRFVTVKSTAKSAQTFTDSQILENVRMAITSEGNVLIGKVGEYDWTGNARLDVLDGTVRIKKITAGSGTVVVADGAGALWKLSSSRRHKTNIRDLENNGDEILGLRPVRFQWTATGQEDIGLIAEEVAESMKDLVIYDVEGKPDAVKYDRMSLYLLQVVKDLKSENESLKRRLDLLEKRMERIERDNAGIAMKRGHVPG